MEVYAAAVRGLLTLEPDPERQLKYVDCIDIYAGLDDSERQQYRERYPNEVETMSSFAERFRQEGIQQGKQQGMQRGMQQAEKTVLLRQLRQKFGEVPLEARRRIEAADAETLLEWLDRVLTASSIDEILHCPPRVPRRHRPRHSRASQHGLPARMLPRTKGRSTPLRKH